MAPVLPDPMGHDPGEWLHALDATIADGVAEMRAGGGVDLDAACDAVLAELQGIAAT